MLSVINRTLNEIKTMDKSPHTDTDPIHFSSQVNPTQIPASPGKKSFISVCQFLTNNGSCWESSGTVARALRQALVIDNDVKVLKQ